MEKMKMHTPNFTDENIAKIAELFPGCITEAQEDGSAELKQAIDFDLLKQELSRHIVEGPKERYHLNWPGKKEALLTANAPIAKTLRPCRGESVEFDTTENLFIEGDNLDALKLLQESYLGKVKMIYIDPPYNTGNDFIYADDFAESTEEYLLESGQKDEEGNRLIANTDSNGRFHSDWISMMYSRLRLAKNLLTDEGVIFVSIDEVEVVNLKMICDEIFGQQNFVEQIAWKNKYGSGALTKGFANVHEYILVYSKGLFESIAAPLDEEQKAVYKQKDDKFKVRGGFITQPLATNSKDDRPNLQYSIFHNGIEIKPEKQWIWSEERFLKAYENDEIVINEKNGKYSVRSKQYLMDENGVVRLGKPVSFLNGPFNQEGTKEIKGLFEKPVFGFPKPTALIKYLLSFVINRDEGKDGIVLDFFGGSASSAHAVMRLNAEDGGNRKFIMVQLPEECDEKSEAFKAGYSNIAEISKERIRRAGKKIKEENAATAADLDTGFRVLKVDSGNLNEVYYNPDALNQSDLFDHTDNLKDDRTAEDLLFHILLDWGLPLDLPFEMKTIEVESKSYDVIYVDGNAMAVCLVKDGEIDEAFCKMLAANKPLRAVFRDAGFKDDSAKINAEQIFKLLSPDTELKTI